MCDSGKLWLFGNEQLRQTFERLVLSVRSHCTITRTTVEKRVIQWRLIRKSRVQKQQPSPQSGDVQDAAAAGKLSRAGTLAGVKSKSAHACCVKGTMHMSSSFCQDDYGGVDTVATLASMRADRPQAREWC